VYCESHHFLPALLFTDCGGSLQESLRLEPITVPPRVDAEQFQRPRQRLGIICLFGSGQSKAAVAIG
jgi:hypothetical protein